MPREIVRVLVAAQALIAGAAMAEAPQQSPVPPNPRAELGAGVPAEAEQPADEEDEDEYEAAGPAVDNEVDEPSEPIVVAPPEAGPAHDPAADEDCRAELAELGVAFEAIEPLEGEGACGAPSPLRVTAVGGIELRPAIRARCPAARALGLWVQRVVAPLADLYMDQSISAVLTATGYQCRRRRGDSTARWSEHAFANAIDVSGVRFDNGDVMAIQPRGDSTEPERSYQAGIRGGACAFFTTVLGPQTNAAHSDHLHLDMAERRGGYRLCE